MSEKELHPQESAASEEITFDESVCSAEFSEGCTTTTDEQ